MKLYIPAITLALALAGCSSPSLDHVTRHTIPAGLPNATAMSYTPDNPGKRADLVVVTPPLADSAAFDRTLGSLCRLGYHILWYRSNPAPGRLTELLAAAHLQTPEGVRRGLLLLGEWPEARAALTDSTLAAVVWLIPAPATDGLATAPPDSAVRRPPLSLIVTSPDPLAPSAALLGWIRTPDNLVWLATDHQPAGLFSTHLEPIVRRKAQLFFDRYLKGKR